MVSLKSHLELMALYNQVMNDRLIAVLTPLPEEALNADRGAFFGSVMGTLNHLLVGDLMWLNRMKPLPYGACLSPLETLPRPTRLDETLYGTLPELAAVRTRLDALIIAFVGGLTDEDIASPLRYQNRLGQPYTKTTGLVLSHLFNHQTHHRGQITTLLSQMGLDIGVTDLVTLIPDV